MRAWHVCGLSAILALALLPHGGRAAEATLEVESWADNDAGFQQCAERIRAMTGRNLLARPKVKLFVDPNGAVGDASLLTDGDAGRRAAEGRVFPNAQPTVLTFYLGEPKPITEVGVFGFNGDMRANQDYEVRFADNHRRPGVMPRFADKPDLTTGDKIIGKNGGGLHSRFVAAGGKPLTPGLVDWVQFRIWRTYPVRAGEAAHNNSATSATTFIEMEVLGEPNDILLPPPEELAYRAALRAAPKQPEFVKHDTWQATLTANRDILLQWEAGQDRLAVHNASVTLGPWYVLGPLSPKSKDLHQLKTATKIDLQQRYAGRDGGQIGWQKCDDLKDGELYNLANYRGAAADDVLLLCRSVSISRPLKGHELSVQLVADRGWASWLPERQGPGMQQTFPLLRNGANLTRDAGEQQLLIELRADGDGRRRFLFALQPSATRPGAGPLEHRASLRKRLFTQVVEQFPAALDQAQMRWEREGGLWLPPQRALEDWLPGQADAYRAEKYRAAIAVRLRELGAALGETAGIKATVLEPLKPRITAWSDTLRKSVTPELTVDQLRDKLYQASAVCDTVALATRVYAMRLAVEDQRTMFQARYTQADAKLARVAALAKRVEASWNALLGERLPPLDSVVGLEQELGAAQREILLDTPLLAFGKLLVVKGHSSFASNWTGPNHLGNELIMLSPVRPDGEQTVVYRGTISDMDLNWDGRRLLFSDSRTLWELNLADGQTRRVSREDPPVSHYDGCYLPDGRIVCASNACEQAVPCTGGGDVGNLHLLDADGDHEHRITFDQDHDWNPVVMNDGRVLYSRWEYTDLPHYFSRMLFRMNPDGTNQTAYYGSNSYWPNAMYWPRPIPGDPTKVVCVVSGHHGVSRVGELLLLDPARGRQEAEGALQLIPGYGKKVDPIIRDNLVGDVWPKFAAPYPLAEAGTNLGAGKYFLACVQRDATAAWDLCLVDVFDNITPILTGGWMTPIPVQARPMPPVIPSQLKPRQADATVYLADVYQGDGLRGYPRGSIKALRIGTHHYRYPGNGDTRASSYEGGWDVKRILGTVPVYEDGSALFRVPANTPIFVQPLDAEGKAQQQMRSWYTAMPGEAASCVGCHEPQNDGPPAHGTLAATHKPVDIAPWDGPVRGLSFDRDVQPVLDRRCVGCHDGQPYPAAAPAATVLDLRAKRLHTDFSGEYSPAYTALQRYVRRAGYESDNHMHTPAEFEADTSALVQILKKGHYNVELSRDDWERLYTWIDYNVPYAANWRESHRPPRDEQVERRAKYQKLFANIDDRDEDPLPLPAVEPFAPPKPLPPPPAPVALAGWSLTPEQAKAAQQAAGQPAMELDLADGVKMKFALVPAGRFVIGDPNGLPDEQQQAAVTIERPFYLGVLEVTNRQYACFDGQHDSAYIEGRGKDRTTRGTPINQPDQPVVRVSWHEVMSFCDWLSQKTGRRCTLPTEAQWEWACRAGTATPFSAGPYAPGQKAFANVADGSIQSWNYGRAEPNYNDGAAYSVAGGRYPANAWGLCDMHGNVAEWCLSVYRPYPYNAGDGRDSPSAPGAKVVRGGSWNDTLRFATSASRWRYQPYQPVYNVGFRVCCEVPAAPGVAASR